MTSTQVPNAVPNILWGRGVGAGLQGPGVGEVAEGDAPWEKMTPRVKTEEKKKTRREGKRVCK